MQDLEDGLGDGLFILVIGLKSVCKIFDKASEVWCGGEGEAFLAFTTKESGEEAEDYSCILINGFF